MTKRRCIALYSGGLDSILAIKTVEAQGIEVIPLYFCSPYFGLDALLDPQAFREEHERRFGVSPRVLDYTDDLAQIIANPPHGFGKHLNPCIDCKIGMLRRARSLLDSLGASFVVTGEVVGQRPMSQRRQIMRLIEKESGLEGILLRPLCARVLPETVPEREGEVDRNALGAVKGRGRKEQLSMAGVFGIAEDDIPSPAGGCLLTDEQISRKVRRTFERKAPAIPTLGDLLLDIAGRRFHLGADTVLVVGRNDAENRLMERFIHPGNVFLRIENVPGPLCILRGKVDRDTLALASGVCLRYGKARGEPGRVAVYGTRPDVLEHRMPAPVMDDDACRSLQD